MSAPRYNKQDDSNLHHDLQAAARDYLTRHNEHRFANRWMIGKLIGLAALCLLFHVGSLLASSTVDFAWRYVGFMFMAMMLAVNVMHDASHNAFFKGRRANRLLSVAVGIPLGMDADSWRVRHVEHHHAHLNVQGFDLDIEENGVLRQTPFQRFRHFMRLQQYYWPLVAALTFPCIVWCFDWLDRSGRTPVAARLRHRGVTGWCLFLLPKLIHLMLALVVPWWALSSTSVGITTILVCYLVSQMLASLVFVVLILGAHWAMGTFYQPPESGQFSHGRYRHIFATTVDWVPRPRWLSYWLGELNRHLTHHLFPHWNHRHYPALANIIAKTAAKHGVPYHCLSLTDMLHAQQCFLTAMGKGRTVTTSTTQQRR